MFWHFWLPNVLRATTACNCSSLLWPATSAPAALASLLLDPPEPQNTGKTQCFATFLPFRAPASSLFWLSPSLIFSISYLLPSDFLHVRVSSWLCFSSVHIVGSFTSKLPSIISTSPPFNDYMKLVSYQPALPSTITFKWYHINQPPLQRVHSIGMLSTSPPLERSHSIGIISTSPTLQRLHSNSLISTSPPSAITCNWYHINQPSLQRLHSSGIISTSPTFNDYIQLVSYQPAPLQRLHSIGIISTSPPSTITFNYIFTVFNDLDAFDHMLWTSSGDLPHALDATYSTSSWSLRDAFDHMLWASCWNLQGTLDATSRACSRKWPDTLDATVLTRSRNLPHTLHATFFLSSMNLTLLNICCEHLLGTCRTLWMLHG